MARHIYQKEKIRGFYAGLSSALSRQAVYGSLRLGLYKIGYNKIKDKKGKVSWTKKAVLSLSTGFIGSFVGNPFDVSLVRFQSDNFLPKEQRRNYKSVTNALTRIIKEEGFFSLWRGC